MRTFLLTQLAYSLRMQFKFGVTLSSFLLVFTFNLFSQEETAQTVYRGLPRMPGNAFHGNVGGGSFKGEGLYFTGTLLYERLLQKKVKDSVAYPYIQIGGGGAMGWGGNAPYAVARFGLFTGVKASHFECNAGAIFPLRPLLSASIGYRYQKPDGNFIFRTGAAWPEGIYVGFGVAF